VLSRISSLRLRAISLNSDNSILVFGMLLLIPP
jgi:hypothetical protein